MSDSLRLATLGALAVDGAGGAAAMLLRRALSRPALSTCDALILTGGLTAHGVAHERRAVVEALGRGRGPQVVLPAPVDTPPHAPAGTAWATDFPQGGPGWPRRWELAEGRCVLFGLDTARLDGGAPAVTEAQLAGLEAGLRALAPEQRRVVALHHRPWALPLRHRGLDGGAPLADAAALGALLTELRVDLVIYGQEPMMVRWRRGAVRLVAAPPLAGCGATGQRFAAVLTLGLEDGAVDLERIHFAPPVGQPALARLFADTESMGRWVSLAERACAAEDSFAAFAEALSARQLRLEAIDEASEGLDGALRALLIRAGAEQEGES